MKIEIWMQSINPKWKTWKKFGSVSLKDAIYLSMDVCPSWYENNILDVVDHYYGTSEYHRSVSDEEFEDIKDVYESIGDEYFHRLNITKSWTTQQDWVIGSQPNLPDDIKESTCVDLRKFLKFAFITMGFENEQDLIPLELKGIESSASSEPVYMTSEDWKSKAREIATEYLMKNPKLSLDQVSDLVASAFSEKNIFSSHGKKEISPSTIKREALSKDAWFTKNQRKKDQ